MKRLSRALLIAAVLVAGFLGAGAYQWQAGGAAFAQPAPARQVVTVRELVIVDEQGIERIVWTGEDARPRLVMRDTDLHPRAYLGFVPPAGEGKSAFWAMNLLDAQQPRAVWAIGADGGGSTFNLRDNHGVIRYSVGYTDQGNGGLGMKDTQGRQRLGLGMPAHAGYSLSLIDEDGQAIWSAPGHPAPHASREGE